MSDTQPAGTDGRSVPTDPDQVRAYLESLLDDPSATILFVGTRRGTRIAVQFFGGPSPDTLKVWEDLIAAYKS